MKKSVKTAIFACIFAAAFQITAFAGFTWKVESADSSYVGTTNVTVTNTSGKKETEPDRRAFLRSRRRILTERSGDRDL